MGSPARTIFALVATALATCVFAQGTEPATASPFFELAGIGFVNPERLAIEENLPRSRETFTRVRGAAAKFARANGITLVLQKAIYRSPNIDITGDVAAELGGQAAWPREPRKTAGFRIGWVEAPRILANEKKRGNRSSNEMLSAANKAVEAVALAFELDLVLHEAAAFGGRGNITDDVIQVLNGGGPDPARKDVFSASVRVGYVDAARVIRESAPAKEATARLYEEFGIRGELVARGVESRAAFGKEYEKRKSEETKKVLEIADKAIAAVLRREALDFVVQETMYHAAALDITDRVIKLLDQ